MTIVTYTIMLVVSSLAVGRDEAAVQTYEEHPSCPWFLWLLFSHIDGPPGTCLPFAYRRADLGVRNMYFCSEICLAVKCTFYCQDKQGGEMYCVSMAPENVKSRKLERVVDRVTQVVAVMSLVIFGTCAYRNYDI